MTISRRQLLAAAPFAALMPSLLTGAPDAHAQAPKPPNILLVLSDDQSARFLGPYGDTVIRTPNFDRFAREGMRFDRAYVASPQCVPSRAAIMTGQSPIAVGMTRFSAPLPAEHVSFPELLRSGAGYFTGICGRSHHLDGSGAMAPETRETFDKNELRTFKKRVDYVQTGDRVQVMAQFAEFLDQSKGKPWFLQLGFSDPHRPLDTNAVSPPHDPAALKLPPFMPDTPALRRDMAHHYDEVSRLDEDFGRVLRVLDERGLTANTLVLFMGDNGAALLRGKGTLYELGVRVPLLARGPGVTRAGASGDLISGEDLAPTFLQAANLPVPKAMTGRSFLPLLRGTAHESRRYAFSQRSAHGSGLPKTTQEFDLSRVVISPTHKLIYNVLWPLPYNPVDFSGQPFWTEIQTMHAEGKLSPTFSSLYFPPARPMFELYDLQNDPNELKNLAETPDSAVVERELKGAMQEWMILNRDYVPLPIGPGGKAATPVAATPQ